MAARPGNLGIFLHKSQTVVRRADNEEGPWDFGFSLHNDGVYSVIERKALDKIIAEQNFSDSDRANPDTAAKIGQLLVSDCGLRPS